MNLKSTILIILTALSLSAFAQQKPRVAVYVTGDNPINEIVGSSLEDGLAHDGKYTAVERTASFLRELSKEHDYQRSGEVDESQIADLGKQFGVEYVCVTSVTDVWGSEKYISARIIDVQTAEVIASGSSNGSISSSSDLVKALDKLSQNILKAMNISKSTKTSKVAIYVTKTGNKDVDVILGDQLVAGFASSGKYLAIERTSRFLSEIKKEQGYQQSGAVDDDELTKLGQKFGVQYVCVAKTTKWGGDYFISTRLIDVKTGEIVNSNNAQGKKLNNSQNVVDVATEIAQKLSGRTIEEGLEIKRQGLVDLGLPSGTLWKDENENGYYTYNDAVSKFGNKLPTKEQWLELKDNCNWKWTGSGYKVTGPNGNSIFLPAAGYRDGTEVYYVGTNGYYWSSTYNDGDGAWYMSFRDGNLGVFSNYRGYVLSVRLVKD